jgi:hypothetical protein
MHPFPPTAELQFLLGEEIAQICLDPYALQFRFAKGGHISVEGRIEQLDRDGNSHSHDCQTQPQAALYLHQLLQRRVVRVEGESYCLSLTFDDGSKLRIFSDDGSYECGHISSNGGLIIVF